MGFGLVQGEGGKKFKTRSGDTVKLADLLDEARDRCLEQMKKRKAEGEAKEKKSTEEVKEGEVDDTIQTTGSLLNTEAEFL